MAQEQSYGLVIDAAAERFGNLIEMIGGWLDNLTAAAKDKFSDFMGACGQRMGELKSSVSRSLSDMRPSSISTPQTKPDITPAVERSPEISVQTFSPTQSVQNALAGIVNIPCVAEDLGADAAVGYDGVGCASQTYSRMARHGAAMVR